MTQSKAVTFGRKASAGAPRAAAPHRPAQAAQGTQSAQGAQGAQATQTLDPKLAAFASELRAETRRDQTEDIAPGEGEVPWSMRAAILAGLFASLLQAGMVVASAQGVVEIIPGLKVDVGQGSLLTPLIILTGLWGGAHVAASAVMLSHFLLRRLGRVAALDYALAGCAAGAADAFMTTLLFGGAHGLLAQAMTGLAAGYFFRLFAGVRRKA